MRCRAVDVSVVYDAADYYVTQLLPLAILFPVAGRVYMFNVGGLGRAG